MFEKVTNDIKVEVTPSYIKEQSDPQKPLFLFSYHIKVTNNHSQSVQLLRRRWVITDALGETEEVEGDGVIGLQPTIPRGQSFEYESFCPLPTPTGSMHGTFFMVDRNGNELTVDIPEFTLAEPSQYH